MQKIIQKILRFFNFEIKYLAEPIYFNADRLDEITNIISGHTMISNTRLVSLLDQVTFCNKFGLSGALVECGVWKGGAVAAMAFATKTTNNTMRPIHLFDSFTDICAPNPRVDGSKALREAGNRANYVPGKPQVLTGIYDSFGGHGTVEVCKKLIVEQIGYPNENVYFHVGWFQDTVAEAAKNIGDIAILRLDGDWYESTKVCLDALYDNVVKGGFIILDDYLTYEGCTRAVDEFIVSRGIKSFLTRVDTSCYFFIKE